MKNEKLIVALLAMCGAMLQTLAGVLPKINSRQSPQDNIVGLTRSDGTVFNGQSTVGLVDENGSFVSARTLANQKVHEKSSLFDEACGRKGERKREEDYGVYFSDKAEVTVADRNVGNAISVNGDHYLKTEDGNLIATIHNHPNGNPWPSILDARAAFIEGRDVLVKNCADDTILRIDHETGDVYLVLKDGSMKYASPDCFFSNDQVRRSYDYQSGISIENLDGHDLYDPKRFRDKKDRDNLAKRDMSESRGSVKKDESDSPELVVQSETNEVDGVRGWCKCLEKQETSYAKSVQVGLDWIVDSTIPMPKYSYVLCMRCGRCRRPRLDSPANLYCPEIFDNQLEMQLVATNGLRTCDYVNARKDVERKFVGISDGQVVFPGKCSCKKPVPIWDESNVACVCRLCGLCYAPDKKKEASEASAPKTPWQCTNCGKVFKTGEEYTIHGLGDCSPASKKEETTERRK